LKPLEKELLEKELMGKRTHRAFLGGAFLDISGMLQQEDEFALTGIGSEASDRALDTGSADKVKRRCKDQSAARCSSNGSTRYLPEDAINSLTKGTLPL